MDAAVAVQPGVELSVSGWGAPRGYLAAPAVAGNGVQGFVKEGASAACTRRGRIPPGSLDSVLFLHRNHMLATENGQTRRIERS